MKIYDILRRLGGAVVDHYHENQKRLTATKGNLFWYERMSKHLYLQKDSLITDEDSLRTSQVNPQSVHVTAKTTIN